MYAAMEAVALNFLLLPCPIPLRTNTEELVLPFGFLCRGPLVHRRGLSVRFVRY